MKISEFLSEYFNFLVVKFSVNLKRFVYVVIGDLWFQIKLDMKINISYFPKYNVFTTVSANKSLKQHILIKLHAAANGFGRTVTAVSDL